MPISMNLCDYSPQISPGNSNITPMPEDPPVVLTTRSGVTLQYLTTVLELRNPDFNDKLVKKFTRIYRNSRGGTLVSYRDPDWPQQDILNWSFRGLSKEKAEAALDFYKISTGKYIQVTTYESQVYKGIIINPNNPISEEGPDGCMYTLKFDFQGTIIGYLDDDDNLVSLP